MAGPRPGLGRLVLAATAVLLAAADTYVLVLALPDIMTSVGLRSDELGQAAPIITVFLLGYVAVLPLVGRLADLTGRLPVLVGCLLVFALGSLVTATGDTLPSVVAGRGLQGVGAGGLVPATLALVADLYPADRRGPPLGAVGAAQEAGALLGPLYGALLLAVSDWRLIFWVNLGAGLVLAAALAAGRVRDAETTRVDLLGWVLALLAIGCLVLLLVAPASLVDDYDWGRAYNPVAGQSSATSPLALATAVLGALTIARAASAPSSVRPVLPVRRLPSVVAEADLPGALLLALLLGGLVLTFSVADPQREVVADAAPALLAGSAICGVLFVVREGRASRPLVPLRALAPRPAYGALVTSLLLGGTLIAALVDVPIFARVSGRDQLDAALLLVRLLAAVPVGAAVGGFACRRLGDARVASLGALLAAAGLAGMAQWDLDAPGTLTATVALVVAGLGLGLTLAPINASALAATDASLHGLASALVVVARTVGMLVGLSALTAIGLHEFNQETARLASPLVLCPATPADCQPYESALRAAAVSELHVVFLGAAACAVAAAAAAWLLNRRPVRIDD